MSMAEALGLTVFFPALIWLVARAIPGDAGTGEAAGFQIRKNWPRYCMALAGAIVGILAYRYIGKQDTLLWFEQLPLLAASAVAVSPAARKIYRAAANMSRR